MLRVDVIKCWKIYLMNPHRKKLLGISSTLKRSLGIIIEMTNDGLWIQSSSKMARKSGKKQKENPVGRTVEGKR